VTREQAAQGRSFRSCQPARRLGTKSGYKVGSRRMVEPFTTEAALSHGFLERPLRGETRTGKARALLIVLLGERPRGAGGGARVPARISPARA
jgi:hypothetical protein